VKPILHNSKKKKKLRKGVLSLGKASERGGCGRKRQAKKELEWGVFKIHVTEEGN